jgi:uncharacterized protein YigE (DUF2233 family)
VCKIQSITKIKGKIVIGCSDYEGDFFNKKVLRIKDENCNITNINDFTVEKPRECFAKSNSPWIMINEEIHPDFLKKGNEVIFE